MVAESSSLVLLFLLRNFHIAGPTMQGSSCGQFGQDAFIQHYHSIPRSMSDFLILFENGGRGCCRTIVGCHFGILLLFICDFLIIHQFGFHINFTSFDLDNGSLNDQNGMEGNGFLQLRIDLNGKSGPRQTVARRTKATPSNDIVQHGTHAPSVTIPRVRFGPGRKVHQPRQGGAHTTACGSLIVKGHSRSILHIIFGNANGGISIVHQISSLPTMVVSIGRGRFRDMVLGIFLPFLHGQT
mmetsp:Transcript_11344/g.23256  ORF Transcript_11344/g.23256 Transcript_11344/m.23256 type:complete len:241 (+) Transcript_11344:1675-2397(+)